LAEPAGRPPRGVQCSACESTEHSVERRTPHSRGQLRRRRCERCRWRFIPLEVRPSEVVRVDRRHRGVKDAAAGASG
jgi:hypothetical protein